MFVRRDRSLLDLFHLPTVPSVGRDGIIDLGNPKKSAVP